MRFDTPLRDRHEAYANREHVGGADAGTERPGAATGWRRPGAPLEYVGYGPPDESGLITCELVSTYGEVEPEYAAIRRGAGLLDCPHRGTLRLGGGERVAFLDRMTTQKLEGLATGRASASFWLNRKGRIDADLLLAELGDEILVDLDVHRAAETASGLDAFVFTEDVEVTDITTERHRLALHGPAAPAVLAAATGMDELATMTPMRATHVTIAGVETVVVRRDQTGAPGFELILPIAGADAVWEALLAQDEAVSGGKRRVRPVGWYAYNTARVEAGTPLFNIDFGTKSIPQETGVLDDRVSFAKGCYPGQEVVARVQNLGKPKQVLVGLRLEENRLPVAEGQVFAHGAPGPSEPIGMVTSSTISPMLGARPVAFAIVKTGEAELGGRVLVNAEGHQAEATVTGLRFWGPTAETTE